VYKRLPLTSLTLQFYAAVTCTARPAPVTKYSHFDYKPLAYPEGARGFTPPIGSSEFFLNYVLQNTLSKLCSCTN